MDIKLMIDGLIEGIAQNARPMLWLVCVFAASLAPLLLALAGHPVLGLGAWALVAGLMATVQRRLTGQGPDWAWALWPLNGLPMAAGILWALADRIRGVNHWRGREVRL